MKKYIFLWTIITCLAFSACNSTKTASAVQKTKGANGVAFYNVENLFDTDDDPKTKDDEFTPTGKKKWTTERYQKKLFDLAKVVTAMNAPSLLGLCEVENEKVLIDLAATDALAKHKYGVVHFDSPDIRGIDVALLYKTKDFVVSNSNKIAIDFPKEIVEDYTTRDILHVEGTLNGKHQLHIFVNHWPSRRGGLTKSEPKRIYVAKQLRKKVNEIFESNPEANIIIMGDLNDETDNKSVALTLSAVKEPQSRSKYLYNCTAALDTPTSGTYRYKSNWNMLDQIIVSGNLKNEKGIEVGDAKIIKEEWMIYMDKKVGAKPNKTYGGPNYYGGFSDHFPVYIELFEK